MYNIEEKPNFIVEKETDDFIYITENLGNSVLIQDDPEYIFYAIKNIFSINMKRLFFKNSGGEITEILHKEGEYSGVNKNVSEYGYEVFV